MVFIAWLEVTRLNPLKKKHENSPSQKSSQRVAKYVYTLPETNIAPENGGFQ